MKILWDFQLFYALDLNFHKRTNTQHGMEPGASLFHEFLYAHIMRYLWVRSLAFANLVMPKESQFKLSTSFEDRKNEVDKIRFAFLCFLMALNGLLVESIRKEFQSSVKKQKRAKYKVCYISHYFLPIIYFLLFIHDTEMPQKKFDAAHLALYHPS